MFTTDDLGNPLTIPLSFSPKNESKTSLIFRIFILLMTLPRFQSLAEHSVVITEWRDGQSLENEFCIDREFPLPGFPVFDGLKLQYRGLFESGFRPRLKMCVHYVNHQCEMLLKGLFGVT